MKTWLGVSVSALALACGALPACADDVPRPAADPFSTERLLSPGFAAKGPGPAAFRLGIDTIADPGPPLRGARAEEADPASATLDTIVTGQISKPDAGHAAVPQEAEPAHGGAKAGAEPMAVPAAAHGGDGAHAAAAPAVPAGSAVEEAPAETTRGPAPFDIIRTIQFLQDQVARGNGRAIRVQAALLRRFGPVFLAADPAVWADGRNRRAALLFVLSGGPPDVIKRLLDSGDLDADQTILFEGALAYVRNDLEEAGKRFSEVDLSGMEPGLAAHVNLVLGQIRQTKSPDVAIAHLDQARLLAPGGLIEEAALRMEVLIAEEKGDHASADRLARQYFDRFARSSYSANFEARFAAVYAGRKTEDPSVSVATILDVTARLPAEDRRSLLLAVARRSLVDGKLTLAERASDAAGAIEGIALPERQRAELYATAARLGRTATSDAALLLDGIDAAELHPDDAKLLDAAHSVVAGIERPLDPVAVSGGSDPSADSSPLFDRAQKLLNEVSDDLGKAQK